MLPGCVWRRVALTVAALDAIAKQADSGTRTHAAAYRSGETDIPGRISKAGDADVRQALHTAAHAVMTRSDAWSTLKAWQGMAELREVVNAIQALLAILMWACHDALA